ncbi:Glycosyltransferase, GT2 family [Kaistia soli DSM 19436]|uniref:Glycosyltransferase, GT2 family n=1 Tax=Kaistia soli DSM 19436 TaxID=1122133 RepID=A0A1M5NF18_9HYPH|nr:glycosyltransferase [Kaistia soli]SHG88111.1 Glycosyltransferase, GT2 family [Kaistia soli DSM 19436]
MPSVKLVVLMTCFNRRALTLAALEAFFVAARTADLEAEVVLVDDASTDGTAAAVAAAMPKVRIETGTGSLFWNGGMRRAWETARTLPHDYVLWLNDDVHLEPDSLVRLLAFQKEQEAQRGPRVISVGKLLDPATGALTYGGYRIAPGLSRLRFVRLPAGTIECDTMNGNCVLIPAIAEAEVGISSPHFTHAVGDIDYGLRAREKGYAILECPEPVARLEKNADYVKKTAALTLSNWRFILFHPKGVPVREWYHFCRAYGGPFWPVNFGVRYLKMIARGLSGGNGSAARRGG